MVRIISLVNQKGGVGKTTTAINLGASLAYYGKRTLLIDLDSQGNATSGLGFAKRELEITSFDILVEKLPIQNALLPTGIPKFSLLPSNNDLLGAGPHLSTDEKGLLQLKRALSEYLWTVPNAEKADYILIDCPPSVGHLTLNAILASDSVLIPVQCEFYALEGLTDILTSATMLRETYNQKLALEGILLTMADRRLNLSRQVEEDIRTAYGPIVFENVIQRSVRLSEAPSHGIPILLYDFGNKGSDSYLGLAQEVIENEKKSSRPWPFRPSA
ncbi:MAG: ParA family protein [bacterium]|nr:ParA family protein [bacterium]